MVALETSFNPPLSKLLVHYFSKDLITLITKQFGLSIMENGEELFDDTIKLIKEHLFSKKYSKIRTKLDYNTLKNHLQPITPINSNTNEVVIESITKYIENSVKTNEPGFMQSLWGGTQIPGILGELLAAATNTSMYTFDTAPPATVIEKTIISKMNELIGWENGEGIFTSGGSNGNLLGLACARNYAYPEYSKKGNMDNDFQIFVSTESHYSVEKAAKIIGIGTDNIIHINCDKDGKMDVDDLDKKIRNSIDQSKNPLCVVATGGTTVRGNFDPINEISEICKKYDIWLHLDAAWGGAALLSEKHKHLLAGIDKTNSICWDPHKLMGVPLICSAFLVENPEHIRTISSCVKTPEYLFHGKESNLDLGKLSIACGRRVDVIKLWLTWVSIGSEGWAKRIDYCMELAKYLEEKVLEHPNLELMSIREFTNVCFRWKPEKEKDIKNINLFNINLRHKLVSNGNYMVSLSNLNGDQILRPVIAHPTIQKSTLDKLILEIETIAKTL